MNKIYVLFLILLFLCFSCVDEKDIEGSIKNIDFPEVNYVLAKDITASSAVIEAEVLKQGGAPVISRGATISTTFNITDTTGHLNVYHKDGGIGKYSIKAAGLKNNTVYYIRPFAVNEKGLSFAVANRKDSIKTNTGLGSLVNLPAQEVTAISAICGGRITDRGEGEIKYRGVIVIDSTNITQQDTLYSDMKTDSFTVQLTELKPLSTYYSVAIVKSIYGEYENESDTIKFKTGNGLPTIDNSISILKQGFDFVSIKGEVLDEGDAPVTERGICYSLKPNPTIKSETVLANKGKGSFEATIKDMQPETAYYAKGYAINSFGIVYTEEIETTTLSVRPTVNLLSVTLGKDATALVKARIVDPGKGSVIEAGVCWGTQAKPRKEDAAFQSATKNEDGTFEFLITGLKGESIYYINAYAVNDASYINYSVDENISTPSIFTSKGLDKFAGTQHLPRTASFIVSNNIGYLLGGDMGNSYSSELWHFDMHETPQWFMLRDLPKNGVKQPNLFSRNNGFYIFGGLGHDNQATDHFLFYNVRNNMWNEISWDLLPPARFHSANTVIDDRLLMIGGHNNTSVLSDVWTFSGGQDGWKEMAELPISQQGGIAFSTDDQTVYAGLGVDEQGKCNNTLWRSTNELAGWQVENDLYPGIGCVASTYYNGLIYAIDETSAIWTYSLDTKEWNSKSQVPFSRVDFIVEINGGLYIGLNNGTTMIKYDPTWDN